MPLPLVSGTNITSAAVLTQELKVEVKQIDIDLTADAVLGEATKETAQVLTDSLSDEIDTDFARREVVYEFHIGDYIRLENAVPPYNINLVGIEEHSGSIIARTEGWSADNPFLTMDTNGIVKYRPRGSYLSNRLRLLIEVTDQNYEASPPAEQAGEVYRGDGDNEEDPESFEQASESTRTEEAEINMTGKSRIIGDAGDSDYHESQGMNPTCAITATYALLKAAGHIPEDISLDDFISDFSTFVTGHIREGAVPISTNPLRYRSSDIITEGNVDSADAPAYLLNLPSNLRDELGDIGLYETVVDTDGNVLITRYTTQVEPIFIPNGQRALTWMLDRTGVEYHTGHASDFTTLIRELEAGHKILVGVDYVELWNNYIITDSQVEADVYTPGINTRANHAAWITGIDVSDPDNPIIILNDSAQGDGGSRYPLAVFLSAWEDGEYGFVSVGSDDVPDNGHSKAGAELAETMNSNLSITDLISSLPAETRETLQEEADTSEEGFNLYGLIHNNLKDPRQTVAFLQAEPEVANLVLTQLQTNLSAEEFNSWKDGMQTWLDELVEERDRIINTYGLDLDVIEQIQDKLFDE